MQDYKSWQINNVLTLGNSSFKFQFKPWWNALRKAVVKFLPTDQLLFLIFPVMIWRPLFSRFSMNFKYSLTIPYVLCKTFLINFFQRFNNICIIPFRSTYVRSTSLYIPPNNFITIPFFIAITWSYRPLAFRCILWPFRLKNFAFRLLFQMIISNFC